MDESNDLMEWRWVDDKGRAMTEWKRGDLPPFLGVSGHEGFMWVEVRHFQVGRSASYQDWACKAVGGCPACV